MGKWMRLRVQPRYASTAKCISRDLAETYVRDLERTALETIQTAMRSTTASPISNGRFTPRDGVSVVGTGAPGGAVAGGADAGAPADVSGALEVGALAGAGAAAAVFPFDSFLGDFSVSTASNS